MNERPPADDLEPFDEPDDGFDLDSQDEELGPVWRLIAVAVVLGIIAAIVLLAIALFPHAAPKKANPGWLDAIFENRWVIWMVRMTGLVGLAMFAVFAVYFIRSIVARIQQRHWLRSGGPFHAEIPEQAATELDVVDQVFESMGDLEIENAELRRQLGETNTSLQALSEWFDSVMQENAELRAALEAGQQDHPRGP
jgi:hypothetical protein